MPERALAPDRHFETASQHDPRMGGRIDAAAGRSWRIAMPDPRPLNRRRLSAGTTAAPSRRLGDPRRGRVGHELAPSFLTPFTDPGIGDKERSNAQTPPDARRRVSVASLRRNETDKPKERAPFSTQLFKRSAGSLYLRMVRGRARPRRSAARSYWARAPGRSPRSRSRLPRLFRQVPTVGWSGPSVPYRVQ